MTAETKIKSNKARLAVRTYEDWKKQFKKTTKKKDQSDTDLSKKEYRKQVYRDVRQFIKATGSIPKLYYSQESNI